MILHNWPYKLLAVVVAFGLWAYVYSERNSTKQFTVPLEERSVPADYYSELSDRTVTVTVRGLKIDVQDLTVSNFQAWVDLKRAKVGQSVVEQDLPVKCEPVGGSTSNLDVSVSPKTVRVRIEPKREKRIGVEVKFSSAPPLGYSYTEPILSPGTVSVSGRASEVAKVARVVLTLPNQIPHGPVDDVFELAAVNAAGGVMTGVIVEPPKSRIRMQLIEVPSTKSVIISPSITGSPTFPARVSKVAVTPSSVTIEGRARDLISVSTIGTEPISVDGALATVTKDVELRVPPGVRIVGRSMAHVTVTIGPGP